MRIPLNAFENVIEEAILKKGLFYFQKGAVREPEEIEPGKFETVVEGTENYTVRFVVNNGVIIEHTCTCPYDMGPICKHQAAFIFHLQQEALGLKKKSAKAKTAPPKKPAKPKTIAQKIEYLLDELTHEEMKQFIRGEVSANRTFRDLFLASFAHYFSNPTQEDYQKQIKALVRAAYNSDRYIDRKAANTLCNSVDKFLKIALAQIENQNFQSAFYIAIAIMEQLSPAVDDADNAGNGITECVEDAQKLLLLIAEQNPPEEIRKLIIEYCFSSFEKKIFSEFDWHYDLLLTAAHLIKSEKEKMKIYNLIDKTPKTAHEKFKLQKLKHTIIAKTEGEEAAENYLNQNIDNPDFRWKSIQNALNEKNYAKAIALAREGASLNRNMPVLFSVWTNTLLEIAQAQNDTGAIIEHARKLLLHNCNNKQDYYQILKQTVEPEKWNAFIEEIVQVLEKKGGVFGYHGDLIARIYIEEQWWDKLFKIVMEPPNIENIVKYENFLAPFYTTEIVDAYYRYVKRYLQHYIGRDHYQKACSYIRRIIRLGAQEKADELISHLRAVYGKRAALMEELDLL